jgi:hypothetical protein
MSKRQFGKRVNRNIVKRRRQDKKKPPLSPLEILAMNPYSSLVTRSLGEFIPEQLFCRLRYPDVGVRTNSAGSAANWRFRSSAYDADPLLGGGSLPGFTELATLYGRYRVHGIGIDTVNINMETKPLYIAVWASNEDYGSNLLSTTDVIAFGSNPNAISKIIAPTPYGEFRYSNYWSMAEITGGQGYLFENDWQALTSTNPANFVFINIGLAPTSGTLTAGLGTHNNTQIEMFVEFFGRRTLVS